MGKRVNRPGNKVHEWQVSAWKDVQNHVDVREMPIQTTVSYAYYNNV